MRTRAVRLAVVIATAVAVLSACNLREGPSSEYGLLSGPRSEQNSSN